MRRLIFPVLAAVALAGCSSLPSIDLPSRFLGDDGPSRWSVETDPAMAPDFSRQGPSFPVLIIHQHHVPSERQREAMKNVMCQEKDGRPLLPLRPMETAMMEACEPVADAATGRVFLEREEMRARGAEAIALVSPECYGGIIFLGKERREFIVNAPGHDFLVEFGAGGAFAVDGIAIQPGSALKISYYLHDASDKDREFVRAVFEAPGEWLYSRMAPANEMPDGRRDIPPRPNEGTGLSVHVPLVADTLRAPFDAALAAMPLPTMSVLALRAVRDTDRFTELTIVLASERGTVTWFGVERGRGTMTLLGAEGPAAQDSGVSLDAIDPFLDLAWADLRGGSSALMTDVRLANDTAWATAGIAPIAAPDAVTECANGCVMLQQDDGAWMPMLAPEPVTAQGAATLHVIAFDAEEEAERWWHVPAGPIGIQPPVATRLPWLG